MGLEGVHAAPPSTGIVWSRTQPAADVSEVAAAMQASSANVCVAGARACQWFQSMENVAERMGNYPPTNDCGSDQSRMIGHRAV